MKINIIHARKLQYYHSLLHLKKRVYINQKSN